MEYKRSELEQKAYREGLQYGVEMFAWRGANGQMYVGKPNQNVEKLDNVLKLYQLGVYETTKKEMLR